MATITREETVPGTVPEPGSDAVARAHLLVAFVFLVAGAALGLVLALKLTFVGFLDGAAALSFGRLRPAYTGTVLFGWLTLAQIGSVYYLLPRLTGTPLWNKRLADLSFGLLTAGFVAGVVAVLAGASQGRELLEFPWFVDLAVVAGLAGSTLVVTRTIAVRREPVLYVSLWFFLAGMWWMLLNYALGALPGTTGVDLAVLARSAAVGVQLAWVLPIGLGIGYYLVPRLTGNPLYSHRLGIISFWSLALAVPWLGPVGLAGGPVPEWLQTIGTMFTIALLVPIGAAFGNWVLTMQGAWSRVATEPPLAFLAAAAGFVLLVPVQLAGLTLRGSGSILQFTSWVEAGFVILVWGAGTSFALAVLYHARPSAAWARRHLAVTVGGLALLIGVLWIGGLVAGFGWNSAPVSDAFTNYGEGFVNTTARLAPFDAVRWVAWAIVFAGQLVGLTAVATGRWGEAAGGESEPAPAEEGADADA